MSRFPKLSETFVSNEILAVERAGARVEIHPLLREQSAVVQPSARPLVERAHFQPLLSRSVAAAQVWALRHRPLAWLGCLAALVSDTWRSPGHLARSLMLFPEIVQHARLIQAEGVEHVHCHFATYPAFAGFVIQRLTGIPYSFTAHAHDIHLDGSMLALKVREAAFVVSISEDNRRRIGRIAGPDSTTPVHVIHCGVDTEVFSPPSGRQELSGRPLSILSVGRLIPMKGHVALILACARLAAAGAAFRCRIVGDGPLREVLLQRIAAHGLAGRVELLGPRTGDEVRELLHEADAFVAPSIPSDGRMEGIPVVLMEAMSSRLPVVASRMTGIPELVRDGENGFLVEPGDAAALAEALETLAADPELRERFGRAGRQRVLAEFDLDTQAAALTREFEKVIAGRRPAEARLAVAR
jgi:colanic acid/amylovoran biosynthesis glycosyltransferase